MRTKQLALAAVSAAALVAAGASSAYAAPVKPVRTGTTTAYACPNHYLTVTASAARVRPNHSLSSPAIGELLHGAKFCLESTNYPTQDGHTWAAGYGYNGGTRLSGWVATDLLGNFH